jgi:GT2 family glycosyltransferase
VSATVLIPTLHGGTRLARLLESLRAQTLPHQVIVLDNGSEEDLAVAFPEVEVIPLRPNAGFGRAVNIGAARAEGETLVLLNDDCTCQPQFLAELVDALDPARGVVMAAGVLVEPGDAGVIDSAGMELDGTLLPFDYLNGEPIAAVDSAPDPIGPSAAAAAFDRETFIAAGGFDEKLFAYWEDVDLVLRLRSDGAGCALARRAVGTHEHSATLGTGSVAKNYLMGFGRGYVARKWGVLTPSRLAAVLLRDVPVCLAQAAVDRNVAGVRGRIDGFRAASEDDRRAYPTAVMSSWRSRSAAATLVRRRRRRARLGRNPETATA